MSDYDLIIRLMMKKYKPVFFDQNYTTYKVSEKLTENPQAGDNEAKAIFFKNYRSLYPLNEEVLDRMVKTSDFPKELLDKLVTKFPDEDKDLFYERCEQMHQLRLNAAQQQNQ